MREKDDSLRINNNEILAETFLTDLQYLRLDWPERNQEKPDTIKIHELHICLFFSLVGFFLSTTQKFTCQQYFNLVRVTGVAKVQY